MTPEEALAQSRLELREAVLAIHEDMLEIKKQISDLRDTIRNRWWIPVAVALIAMVGNTIVALHFAK